jgi:hypothetical protein
MIRHTRTIGIAAVLACRMAVAQNEDDAMRLSFTQEGGTARSAAMANAFGALGADPISAEINPAGIGLYVASEFSLTMALEVNDAASQFYGTGASGTQSRFYLPNFSLILHAPTEHNDGWRAFTYGLAYDRQATFHWDRQVLGEHVNSTLLTDFVNEANGIAEADLFYTYPYTSGLAYGTYAIDPVDSLVNTYVAQIPQGADQRHQYSIESHGRVSSTSFFLGANYNDRLYLGAAVGIIGTRLTRTTKHNESNDDPYEDLQNFQYREDLTMDGTGIDIKVGAIVRLTDRLRAGLSYRSPRWNSLDDVFATEMATSFRTPDTNGVSAYAAYSPESTFAYEINTPQSVVASLAYVVGQNGAIGIDYEWKDYRKAKIRATDELMTVYDFSYENQQIGLSAAMSHSVRVGTEWKAGPWRFRAGWGIWPDPYSETDARHGLPLTRYTAGLGWRNDHLSVDFAGQYDQRTYNYFPYDPSLVQVVNEELTSYRGILTVAWRP